MKQPHKHAELIKAWADGAEIEVYWNGKWEEADAPVWNTKSEYRIKPEPKPDVVVDEYVAYGPICGAFFDDMTACNIRLTFDGETGKLKKAEVLE